MEEAIEVKSFKKNLLALRYWFHGRQYYNAARAIEFGMSLHKGTRKDKITPEFSHQVSICQMLRVGEAYLKFKEETFIAVLVHDIMEDYNIGQEEIELRYGKIVGDAVLLLTKKFRGAKKVSQSYYDEIAGNQISSVVKAYDRVHNFSKMVEVFTKDGQLHYVEETETLVLPMIKVARRLFPEQEPVYENAKTILLTQLNFVKIIHEAKGVRKNES